VLRIREKYTQNFCRESRRARLHFLRRSYRTSFKWRRWLQGPAISRV